tara:strand:- start:807 stop:1043 length:237 start_codon:yes stop_codon:yes gene_type:complete
MRNITQYSDDELALIVFNDEYFYIERLNRPYLIALIREEIVFTNKQLSVLITALDEDVSENILETYIPVINKYFISRN